MGGEWSQWDKKVTYSFTVIGAKNLIGYREVV
ncbi:hypothetical protein NNRS527_02479 [Nitrosospira sp. NRS527]|nr:hypothetical protein NNRS527_02479 [Nitrosospira sp. NRS527]